MKRKHRLIDNNKGAALVTIMIAVAFISILASSLLYMAVTNYKMKVVNYESKVNFYGTEHDMNVLSTTIRNDVTLSGNPIDKLEELVGYDTVNSSYNPAKLAQVVYPEGLGAESAVYITKDRIRCASSSADMVVKFSSLTSQNNYTMVDDGVSQKKITLSGVVIEQTDLKSGYVNKITTDLVFKVRETDQADKPGGIGEFSILTDGKVSGASGKATRITMYGNTFIGPGEYKYTNVNGTTVVDPSQVNALELGGNSVYTVNGDYMVVFGNIVLDGNAVLNVISGNLTVFGDIIVKGKASFVCTGKVFFPETLKPGNTAGYGIYCEGGNANNIVPKSLYSDSTGISRLTEDDYNNFIKLLKLDDSDKDNDGILSQIIATDYKPNGTNVATIWDYQNVHQTDKIEYFGIQYQTAVDDSTSINAGDYQNNLCFLMKEGNITIGDGANLHATMITRGNIVFDGSKNILFSQLGEEVFNYLTREESDTEFPASLPYDPNVHEIHSVIKGANGYVNSDQSADAVVGKFFKSDANETMDKALGIATGGGSSPKLIETAVGYVNWTKE